MTVRVGDEVPATHKKVYQRSFVEKTYGPNSIHNDDYTKQHGYPGALISAYVLAGYVSEVLVNFFGESWLTTGKYNLAFTGKGVQQGDAITCGAVVTGVDGEPGGDQKVDLDVWIEKAGVRPVLGRASGILKPAPAGVAQESTKHLGD
jgi:hypothetical protein